MKSPSIVSSTLKVTASESVNISQDLATIPTQTISQLLDKEKENINEKEENPIPSISG